MKSMAADYPVGSSARPEACPPQARSARRPSRTGRELARVLDIDAGQRRFTFRAMGAAEQLFEIAQSSTHRALPAWPAIPPAAARQPAS
jgi:hypothetical protein